MLKTTKRCGACKQEFPVEMFSKHSKESDGLYYCILL